MKAAKNKSLRKNLNLNGGYPNGTFIKESDLGEEFTQENCSPEFWEELHGPIAVPVSKDENLPF